MRCAEPRRPACSAIAPSPAEASTGRAAAAAAAPGQDGAARRRHRCSVPKRPAAAATGLVGELRTKLGALRPVVRGGGHRWGRRRVRSRRSAWSVPTAHRRRRWSKTSAGPRAVVGSRRGRMERAAAEPDLRAHAGAAGTGVESPASTATPAGTMKWANAPLPRLWAGVAGVTVSACSIAPTTAAATTLYDFGSRRRRRRRRCPCRSLPPPHCGCKFRRGLNTTGIVYRLEYRDPAPGRELPRQSAGRRRLPNCLRNACASRLARGSRPAACRWLALVDIEERFSQAFSTPERSRAVVARAARR
jgi:hypothetical protein